MELVLTVGLVSVILGTASGAQNVGVFGALGVGGYIILAGLWSSPMSGASMNPARSFGPDLAIADFSNYWVYVVGPIAGALIAVGFAWILRGPGGGRSRPPQRRGASASWRPAMASSPEPEAHASDNERKPRTTIAGDRRGRQHRHGRAGRDAAARSAAEEDGGPALPNIRAQVFTTPDGKTTSPSGRRSRDWPKKWRRRVAHR